MCSAEPKYCVCCCKPMRNRIVSTQVSSGIRKWFLMKKQPLEVAGFIVKYFDILTFELWRVFPKFPHLSNYMVQKILYFYTETSKQFTTMSVTPQVRIWSGIHSPQWLSIVRNCTFVLLSSLCTVSSIFMKNHASCTFLTILCLNGVSRAACLSLACFVSYLWFLQHHLSCKSSAVFGGQMVKILILNCALWDTVVNTATLTGSPDLV